MPRFPPEYCPYCGSALEPAAAPGGHCPDCGEFTVQQPVVAAEVLVVDGDRVLLQQRASGRRAGTWGAPGGHPEPAEAPWTAAVRELEEEAGLSADPADLALVDLVFDRNPDGTFYLVVGFGLERAAARGSLDEGAAETDALAFWSPRELPDDSDLFHRSYRDRLRRIVDAFDGDGRPEPRFMDLR